MMKIYVVLSFIATIQGLRMNQQQGLSCVKGSSFCTSLLEHKAPQIDADFIHSQLKDSFGAGSAFSDEYPELEIIGAGQLQRQLMELMTYDAAGALSDPVVAKEVDGTAKHMGSDQGAMDKLVELFEKRGSDKHQHGYQSFYASILDDLAANARGPIATLEIGLGTNKMGAVSSMLGGGTPGSSNRAFRDYLPSNAEIYGADIDRDILYQEDRIKTAYVDQLNTASYEAMTQELGQDTFNLIVDDGLHSVAANLNTLLFGLKHVRKGGWVVIEDIELKHIDFWTTVVDGILRKNPSFRTVYSDLGLHGGAYLVQSVA